MLATQTEVSDGNLSTINVGIEFFKQSDISVSFDLAPQPLVEGVGYSWVSSTSLTFLPTDDTPAGKVPAGVVVRIRRNTDNTEMLNTYDGGAPFSRDTLDENFEQLLRLTQEFSEGLGFDGLLLPLNLNGFRVTNLGPGVDGTDAVNKAQMDAADTAVITGYQQGDAALQAQLTGNVPLQASAFSPISWHAQTINSSVLIPANKNAWSFGPRLTLGQGVSVTVGPNSAWTIAAGATTQTGPLVVDVPAPLDFGVL